MTEPLYTIGTIGHYGLFDMIDKVWHGTDEGPITYERLEIAEAALTFVAIRFGLDARRLAVLPYDGSGNRMRDHLDPKMSGVDAIRIAEGESPRPRRKEK